MAPLVLVAAEVLFELLEVVQDNRGFAPQGADHLRSGMAALLDEVLSFVLGTTASLLTRAKQLLGRFLRSRRSHSGQCRSGLAQALQVILCSHMESIRPLPLGSAVEELPGRNCRCW